jgi:hypothetical protein
MVRAALLLLRCACTVTTVVLVAVPASATAILGPECYMHHVSNAAAVCRLRQQPFVANAFALTCHALADKRVA